MKTITFGEAQKNFGAVIDYAITGENIQVTRYGRSGVYVIAENEASNELVRKLAARRMIARLKSMQTSEAAKKLTQDDINKLIEDCFA
jgi:antitoxin (DNA-binding transcriptional repressor) of toxin-antitoxin stability system